MNNISIYKNNNLTQEMDFVGQAFVNNGKVNVIIGDSQYFFVIDGDMFRKVPTQQQVMNPEELINE